jgi:hypothetical protein
MGGMCVLCVQTSERMCFSLGNRTCSELGGGQRKQWGGKDRRGVDKDGGGWGLGGTNSGQRLDFGGQKKIARSADCQTQSALAGIKAQKPEAPEKAGKLWLCLAIG